MSQPRSLLLVLALLLAAAPRVGGQDEGAGEAASPATYFPLDEGLRWTYQAAIGTGDERQELVYTMRVSGSEVVEGKRCLVLETRSGAKLFERQWYYVDEEGRVRNLQRQQFGRTSEPLAFEDAGAGDRPPLPGGRVLLDPALMEPGSEWSFVSRDKKTRGVLRVMGAETVDVGKPLRVKFECLVLRETVEYGDQARQVRTLYLAPNVGIVKEVTEITYLGAGRSYRSEAFLTEFPKRS